MSDKNGIEDFRNKMVQDCKSHPSCLFCPWRYKDRKHQNKCFMNNLKEYIDYQEVMHG